MSVISLVKSHTSKVILNFNEINFQNSKKNHLLCNSKFFTVIKTQKL